MTLKPGDTVRRTHGRTLGTVTSVNDTYQTARVDFGEFVETNVVFEHLVQVFEADGVSRYEAMNASVARDLNQALMLKVLLGLNATKIVATRMLLDRRGRPKPCMVEYTAEEFSEKLADEMARQYGRQ